MGSFAWLASSKTTTTIEDFVFQKKIADEAEVIEESTEVIEESTEVEKAPVKRGRGRPKGTTKSGLPYVPKPKSGLGRGRPKGSVSKPKAKTAPKSTNGSRSRPKKD